MSTQNSNDNNNNQQSNNDNMTFYMFEYDEFNCLTKVYHNETKLIEYVYLYSDFYLL